MKSLSRRKYNYHYPIEQYHNYTWYCLFYTQHTKYNISPVLFQPFLSFTFFKGGDIGLSRQRRQTCSQIWKVQMRQKCQKFTKRAQKLARNWHEKTVRKWLGCLLDFEGLCRPWLFEEKIPRRRKYVNNKYSFLGSIPPLAAIGVWYRLVPTLTSLVFQRCLWLGKWSDLGSDSRLSGSLIGSPSANRWW